MNKILYYKQIDEDGDTFYGLREITDSDAGKLANDIYAGDRVEDLAYRILELKHDMPGEVIVYNITKAYGHTLPLDSIEVSKLEKIICDGFSD